MILILSEHPGAGFVFILSQTGIAHNRNAIMRSFGGRSKAMILTHAAVGHNFWHLGEAVTVRSLAGASLPI
jgi:hypothetical protein